MSIDPYHSPYPHPGQVLQEVLGEMRAIHQEAQQVRYMLQEAHNWAQLNQTSGIHHLIKEAVNVAITEVITQERGKDDGSFLGYLQRRTVLDGPAERTASSVESTDPDW